MIYFQSWINIKGVSFQGFSFRCDIGIEFDTTSLSQSDIEQIIADNEPGDESEL